MQGSGTMHPSAKFLVDLFVQEWALKLINVVWVPAFLWFVVWIFGKDPKKPVIAPSKRKWFTIAAIFAAFVGTHIFSVTLQTLGGGRSGNAAFDCEMRSPGGIIARDANNPEETSVTYEIGILNRGDASVTRKWKCWVVLVSGQTNVGRIADQPTGLHLMEGVDLPPDRYLPNVLSEIPLGRNQQKVGWVNCRFGGGIMSEVTRPGSRFFVEFEDANRNKTSFDWIVPIGLFPRGIPGVSPK